MHIHLNVHLKRSKDKVNTGNCKLNSHPLFQERLQLTVVSILVPQATTDFFFHLILPIRQYIKEIIMLMSSTNTDNRHFEWG